MSVHDIVNCHLQYGYIEDIFPPSLNTVLCTIAIIVLTICIEIRVNAGPFMQAKRWSDDDGSNFEGSHNNTDQDQNNDVPPPPYSSNDAETSPTPISHAQPPKTQGLEEPLTRAKRPIHEIHTPAPSPTLRATRLVVATVLLIPLTIAFALRIRETYITYPYRCQRALSIAPTQWWAITIFNIIPFISAYMAWLRALVDCVLVRWGRHLEMWVWPPMWPVSVVVIFAAGIGIAVRDGLVAVMRGKGEGDLEMGGLGEGEERRGLMEDGDDDLGTAHSPRSSVDLKFVRPVSG